MLVRYRRSSLQGAHRILHRGALALGACKPSQGLGSLYNMNTGVKEVEIVILCFLPISLNSGSSTRGEIEHVLLVGPMAPATKHLRVGSIDT